jgi:hypothetical protein
MAVFQKTPIFAQKKGMTANFSKGRLKLIFATTLALICQY